MLQLMTQTKWDHTAALPSSLTVWIGDNIRKPIKGFEHKRNADGSFYTPLQQLHATQRQVRSVAYYFLTRGKSEEEVKLILHAFVKFE